MIPVAIECPKQSIVTVLVNNLDHQCIKTSTNVPITCIISEVEKFQLLCDNIAASVVSKSAARLVLVLAFLGGP
jgi:hypothetical protein